MSRPKGSADINHDALCFLPRRRGSLTKDYKKGRPAGTPRSAQEIENQKASIAKSREAGTWHSGGFKQMRRTE